MPKKAKILKESIINLDFATSTYVNDKPFNDEQIKEILDKQGFKIRSSFRENHMLTSKEFSFITYANFNVECNCSLKGDNFIKTDKEKIQAKQNLYLIEEFLSLCLGINIKLSYVMHHDNECILYDLNRYKNSDRYEMFYNVFQPR